MTSIEQNKALVRRFFEEVFNQGNLSALDEIIAPGFGGHGFASHGREHGPDNARKTVATFKTAFLDIHFDIEEMIAEDDKVVVRITFSGTHQGSFMGIAATGKTVKVGGVELARIADGKIVEEGWHFMDEVGLLQQLGALHH
jgi:steroid delta-isomerase-like uncharacterized protein